MIQKTQLTITINVKLKEMLEKLVKEKGFKDESEAICFCIRTLNILNNQHDNKKHTN